MFKLVVAGVSLCCVLFLGQAKAVDYRSEYAKKVDASQNVGALGDDLGGDQINFFTGGVEFAVTDLSIPGNFALPVAFSRRYGVEPSRVYGHTSRWSAAPIPRALGDWDIDLPYMTGMFAKDNGWEIESVTPTQRCSIVGQVKSNGAPATGNPRSDNLVFPKFWHGNTLHVPGYGDQKMLVAMASNSIRPTTGGPYHWVTKENWWFSCLSATKNGKGGEAFLAISPEGTKYYFDWLSERVAPMVDWEGPDGREYTQTRKEVFLLVSKVVDRFGNTVDYNYSADAFAKLTSIVASDGRQIHVGYDPVTGRVTTVGDGALVYNASTGVYDPAVAGTRTWNYQYVSGQLRNVVLPDASKWQYFFDGLNTEMWANDSGCVDDHSAPAMCYGNPELTLTPNAIASGYLFHPSGARVDYEFTAKFVHSKKGPTYYLALDKKTISGGGAANSVWRYSMAPNVSQAQVQCAAGACPTRTWVDILGPNGQLTRHLYDLDGKLLQRLDGEQVSSGNSSPVIAHSLRGSDIDIADDVSPITATLPVFYRETDNFYAPPTVLGTAPLGEAAVGASNTREPLYKSIQYLQGSSFTWEVTAFDEYANPLAITSTGAGLGTSPFKTYTRKEVKTYLNDMARWILGQVKTTNCVLSPECNSTLLSETIYDSNSLPWIIKANNQEQATNTYSFSDPSALGALSTVTDGRSNTITLANWKRGIPTLITFPAAPNVTTMRAEVSDAGLIKYVVDQTGGQTCYQYDSVGRLTGISYPSETAAAPSPPTDITAPCDATGSGWNRLVRSFAPLTAAEYGLPAGVWKDTVTTGTGRNSTWYDARWRPVLKLTEDTTNASTKSFAVSRYDASGRKIFQSYPVGSLTTVNDILTGVTSAFDALGRNKESRQHSELGDLVTATEYLTGFRTKVTNPRGYATTTSYQAYNSPSTDSPVEILLPEGVKSVIDRELALAKPVSVTRSGPFGGVEISAVRRYLYDGYRRLCESIDPESGATIVQYDGNNNIAWSADGQASSWATPGTRTQAEICSDDRALVTTANKISRTYDALNRELTRTTASGNENVTTTYFADGQVNTLTAANPGGNNTTTTYTYNKRRLLTREVLQITPSVAWTFDYAYNANGHLNSQTYPGSLVVGYAPDGLGRPTQAGTFATGVTYYPNGAMSGFTYGNGITHSMTQNARQLPSRSQDSYVNGGITTKVLDDTFTYDHNGNVSSLDDASNAPTTDNRTWGKVTNAPTVYDGLDRLISVRSTNQWGALTGNYNAMYSYDPLDNLRSNRLGAGLLTYGYNANNQLASLTYGTGSAQSVTTDARGNITANAYRGQAYEFDLAHRMNAVTGKESYLYDGNGRRVRTVNQVNGTVEYFGYSKDGRLLQDWSNRRQVRNGYIYLGNTIVGLYEVNITNGLVTPKYQHTDALGSPVVTSKSGVLPTDPPVVLSRMSYTPYGAPTMPMDGVGYTGHFMDVGTQLTYMQQRYYDPQVGRFLSNDPAPANPESGGRFNRYQYALLNPLVLVDPDGRQEDERTGIAACKTWECMIAQEQEMILAKEMVDALKAEDRANRSNRLTGDPLGDAIHSPTTSEARLVRTWQLDRPTRAGGWIIQKVVLLITVRLADGTADTTQKVTYWEAWRVEPTKKRPNSGFADGFKSSGANKIAGRISWLGTANFYEGLTLPRTFQTGNVEHAWRQPATYQDPGELPGAVGPPVIQFFIHEWPRP